MNVSVPDKMRDWVQARIDSGQYASASDYVRDLIRRDQASAQREQMIAQLDAAISEGIADADAGRVFDLDEVVEELDAKYERMSRGRN